MNYTVAFVGNPNVGKSAWINALSNAHFQVGNWPGVTIERKEAVIDFAGDSYHLIDLPGVYSLDEQTNEEAVTSQMCIRDRFYIEKKENKEIKNKEIINGIQNAIELSC